MARPKRKAAEKVTYTEVEENEYCSTEGNSEDEEEETRLKPRAKKAVPATKKAGKKQRVASQNRQQTDDQEMRKFILGTFQEIPKTRGKGLWQLLPETWKQDQEVAFFCWQRGMVGKNAPPSCLDDEFFRTKVEQGAFSSWSALPQRYRKNSGFARSVSVFPDNWRFLNDMLQLLPELSVERNVWVKAIDSNVDLAKNLGQAPTELRADKGLMLKACLRSGECLRFVGTALQLDRKFLEDVLAGAPVALKHIASSAQQASPELMADHFQAFSAIDRSGYYHHRDYEELARNVRVDLWSHRHTVTSWFKAGLPFPKNWVPDSITNPWASDKELLLLLATNCKGRNAESFQHASQIPSCR